MEAINHHYNGGHSTNGAVQSVSPITRVAFAIIFGTIGLVFGGWVGAAIGVVVGGLIPGSNSGRAWNVSHRRNYFPNLPYPGHRRQSYNVHYPQRGYAETSGVPRRGPHANGRPPPLNRRQATGYSYSPPKEPSKLYPVNPSPPAHSSSHANGRPPPQNRRQATGHSYSPPKGPARHSQHNNRPPAYGPIYANGRPPASTHGNANGRPEDSRKRNGHTS